jgi:phytoene dehydrogenase-like protein
MSDTSFDVIVVGSGHNGMITAAYLARAGLKVGVFERRPIVGGAVCTQTDLIPGYRIDVGSSAHVMIHQTPIVKDLQLAQHGLEYIEMDPWGFYPAVGNNPSFKFYRDVGRTCDSISRLSQHDADAYAKFVARWNELNEKVFKVFLRTPTPINIGRSLVGGSLRGEDRMGMIRLLLAPYGRLIDETFEHPSVRTAIAWLAAQSGPPPSEPATGDFAGWHGMYHVSGMKRAKGGSGALTQALKKYILAAGGSVFEDAPVDSIDTHPSGRIKGIILKNGAAYSARAVVAACHIKTTVEQLLRDAPLEGALRHKVSHLRIGNGFGMIVRCAMSGLPAYTGETLDRHGVGECHHGLQLLCPSRQFLDRAYGDYAAGRTPERPVPLVMTFSSIDPTLAPEGKHVMFVWGQYFPYEMADGADWKSIQEREADKLLAEVDQFAPGTSEKVLDRFIQTPLQLEEMHGLHKGNVMHLEMSIDQMFSLRPLPELSSYRMPLPGLYLTGASMHPGGGVWGASGYNTAHLMLKERGKWR